MKRREVAIPLNSIGPNATFRRFETSAQAELIDLEPVAHWIRVFLPLTHDFDFQRILSRIKIGPEFRDGLRRLVGSQCQAPASLGWRRNIVRSPIPKSRS